MKSPFAVAGCFAAVLCVGCGQSASPAGPSPAVPDNLLSGSAAAQSVPFKGTLEGTQTVTPIEPPMAVVVGQATGTATHLGRFTVQFPHTVNFALARGEGTYTFRAANGDTLTANFIGASQIGPIISIVEEAVITGGTGRFAGATGSFTVERVFVPSSGTTTGSFEGTISTRGGGRP